LDTYQELIAHLKKDRPVLLVTEGKEKKVKHELMFPGKIMSEAAQEVWETKELVWQEEAENWVKAEVFYPPVTLFLLGGGHISHSLAQIADLIGLPVVVIEDRPEFANEERFPNAEVICQDFLTALSSIRLNPSSFVVVATRGHRYDQDCLEFLLKKKLAYIGMVGSKRRVRGLKRNLEELGITTEQLEKLHSPIGLDIKAKSPAEIAVSIIAEIIQEKRTIFPAEEADLEVFKKIEALYHIGEKAVLATIVQTKGSSPRKAGARMLVFPDGKVVGTIGGGCGEAEVKREALNVYYDGNAAIYQLDMTAEAAAEDGMACGGIMKVLLEPVGVLGK